MEFLTQFWHSGFNLDAATNSFSSALGFSTLLVTLAEIGDKTQLLALVLIARYRQPWPIIAGILVATLLNHALAAWLGSFAATWLNSAWLTWVLAAAFILMGGWILIPDSLDENLDQQARRYSSAFVATLVLFFLAEMGDKTQIATVTLGAHFSSLSAVIIGTTLGMLVANVPVIWLGKLNLSRLPIRFIHIITAAIFILTGLAIALFG